MVTAYYNHGRWIVDCPCGAGLQVWKRGLYRCAECGERTAADLPVEHEEIVRLCARRDPKHRNWFPDEPVANLIAENIMHRVPGAPDWKR